MPKLPADGQTVTADYLRNITDDDAKEQLRHPKLWSYILRDPTGMIFFHGHCRTRKACESRAVEHAEGHAGEMLIISTRVPLDGWHFLAWPPSENCDKPVKPRAWRLSKAQMDVLTLCMWHKLSRDWYGWVCDDRTVERILAACTRLQRSALCGSEVFLTQTSRIHDSRVGSSMESGSLMELRDFRCGPVLLGGRDIGLVVKAAKCSITEGYVGPSSDLSLPVAGCVSLNKDQQGKGRQ